MKRFKLGVKSEPYLWLLPCLLLIISFVYLPFLKTIIHSFFIVNKKGEIVTFAGMANYSYIFSDAVFIHAVRNSFSFVLLTVPISIVLGFVLALLAMKKRKNSWFYEALFSLPVAMSSSAMALIFELMFMPSFGLISKLFKSDISWLYDEKTALVALSVIQIWMSSGFSYIFILAALRNIPADIVDAADIDCPNIGLKVLHVYLPLVTPTLIYLLFTNFVVSFLMMSLSNILTGGGPQYSTVTMVQYAYDKFISTGNASVANAALVVTFAVSAAVLALLYVLWRKASRKL